MGDQMSKPTDRKSLDQQIDEAKKSIEKWPSWLKREARFDGSEPTEQELLGTYRPDQSLCATERHQFPDGSVIRLPMGSRVEKEWGV